MYNAKNYTEQGGETTRFGGKVVFEQGCSVEGLSANPLQPATAGALGGVKVGTGLTVTAEGLLSVSAPLTPPPRIRRLPPRPMSPDLKRI